MLDRYGRYFDAGIVLLEDAGVLRLEALMERDPAAAARPTSMVLRSCVLVGVGGWRGSGLCR